MMKSAVLLLVLASVLALITFLNWRNGAAQLKEQRVRARRLPDDTQ